MGRPNRGIGSAGVKKPGNTGGREQYNVGGSKSTNGNKSSKTTKKQYVEKDFNLINKVHTRHTNGGYVT